MISQAGSFGYDYNNAEDLVERLSLPGGSAVTNDYDGVGRLLETVLRSSGGTLRNAHGYELNDGHQRTQQTFTEGNYVDYTYDDIGQLETAKGKESGGASRLNEQFGYAYDAAWNLNRRTNNALVQSFSVNSRNELTWPEDHYILPGQPPIHSGSKVWTHMDEQGTNGPVVSSILPPRVERRSHASQWDNPAVLFLEHCAVGASGPRFGGEQTYVRNAQAGLTLVTGGKASVQRRNLFQMQVEVAQLTNPQYRYLEDDPSPEQEVDGWKVILGELGPVGSDGRVWKGLPDNAEFDVTPKVTPALSPDFYWFTVTPTRHKLSIEANGVELEPDKVVTNAEFCVGQKIVFKPMFEPAVTSGLILTTNGYWWLPPKYVNAWEEWVPVPGDPQSPGGEFRIFMCHPQTDVFSRNLELIPPEDVPEPPYCRRYQDHDWPREQVETGAWWISGGKKAVSGWFSFTFSNGQIVNLKGRGQFLIHKPQAGLNPNSVMIGPVSIQSTGETYPGSELTSGGCIFGATITSMDCSGFANWVQLIDREVAGDGLLGVQILLGQHNTFGSYYLDNDLFYNTQNGLPGTPPVHTPVALEADTLVDFGDEPAMGILSTSFISITDSFKTYLVFNQNPGNADNIWVPLGRVDWSWSGYAAFDIPTSKWVLISGSTNAPAYTDMDEFPLWAHVYSNSE